MLGQSFLRLGLVDEIRLMIAPVILVTDCTYSVIPVPSRSGILKNVVAYKNGLVELLSDRTGANRPTPSLKAVTSGGLP
jgi:riboflavin biosynthesis pyrimidine reductase